MTQPFNNSRGRPAGRPGPGHHSGREPHGRRDRSRRAAEHLARPARPRRCPGRPALRRPGYRGSRPAGHRHVLPPRQPGRRRRRFAGGHQGRGSRRQARPRPHPRPCPGMAAARRPGGAAAPRRPRRRDGRAGRRRLLRPRLLRSAAGRRGRAGPGPVFAACERVLRPGGVLAVITGPAAPGGATADTAGSVVAAARAAGPGLRPAHRPGPRRHRRRPPRPRRPRPGPAAPGGSPVHDDLLVFTKPGGGARS